ncbi:uncharacterized protein AB675_12070 [Cyphellophora attinorum]|uniref:BTB domain-containing protein n=1 Tax=Cyphellophora attinorum TaxID=1664694 RepID=A0A0N1HRE0_9EURO|nr:uncharacterized protein AB675_12070 [Phialophora attinorum]KPI38332.1 hypothetical protein AB675_12070 [Phialophora attinorum]
MSEASDNGSDTTSSTRGEEAAPLQGSLTSNQQEDLDQLYHPLYADFTLKCGDLKLDVQRSVLSRQSDYFQTLLAGKHWAENYTQCINLNDHEPALLEQALRFFYARTYDAVQQPKTQTLYFNFRMASLADSIMAYKLREAALAYCWERLAHDLISVEEMAKVVPLVFEDKRADDCEMRTKLINYCVHHRDRLFSMVDEASDAGVDSGDLRATTTTTMNPFSRAAPDANRDQSQHPPKKRRKVSTRDGSPDGVHITDDIVRAQEVALRRANVQSIYDILEQEEPVALAIAQSEAENMRVLREQLASSISERTVLEEKLIVATTKLESVKEATSKDEIEAARVLRLIRKHTICRNDNCRRTAFAIDMKQDGSIAGLRCVSCNAKHRRTD